MSDVAWAMCTRFDPREDLKTLKGCWSLGLDPLVYRDDDWRNARVVIDACKPYARLDTFPKVVRNSVELEDRLYVKWAGIMPQGLFTAPSPAVPDMWLGEGRLAGGRYGHLINYLFAEIFEPAGKM